MFAGRYLWWSLIAIAGFLFFAVYFDYVSWAIVQCSGCAKGSGSCGPLVLFLSETVKPGGFWLAGAILFVCTIGRIHYLKLSPFWHLVVAAWFLAIGPFPLLFSNIWHGELQLEAIIDAFPIPLLFLAAFGAYLALPFEDDGRKPFSGWRLLHYAVALAAGHSALLAISDSPGLPVFLSKEFGLTHLAAMIADAQPRMALVLRLGSADDAPSYVVLAFFVLSLLASLAPDRWTQAGAASLQPFMPAGSPRRRSGRV
jgi:hypothetical protein